MATKAKNYDVKDLKLADKGRKRVDWAAKDMAVLGMISDRFRKQQPLKGRVFSACLHLHCRERRAGIGRCALGR